MPTTFSSLSIVEQIATIYIATINIAAFFYYGMDKHKSRTRTRGESAFGGNNRRVSEKTLLLLALLGGSPAALLAMRFFRHKTKKLSFQAGIAVILAIQIFGVIAWMGR